MIHSGLSEIQTATKLFYLIPKKVFQSQKNLQLNLSLAMYILFYVQHISEALYISIFLPLKYIFPIELHIHFIFLTC